MVDFVNLLLRLYDHDVGSVLVGGLAAAAHGSSLLTQDVDVCCSFDVPNLLRLQSAIKDLHAVHRMTPTKKPFNESPEELAAFKNLYLSTDWGQIDCLSEVKGIGNFDEVKARSVPVAIRGRECSVLDLPSLIQAKTAMGRPRDREAVIELKSLLEES